MQVKDKAKFQFSFEESPAKKGRCPECGVNDVFRFYSGLPKDYGICERKNNCGYHRDPNKESAEMRAQLRGHLTNHPTVQSPAPTIEYPAPTLIQSTLEHQNTNFHVAIRKINISDDHLLKWGVGGFQEHTAFVYQNKKKALNVKYIPYDESGKRNKNKTPFYLPAGPNRKYKLCLFGEHLLSDKIICLVESEKTAVIASYFYPDFDWLATGSSQGLTDEKAEVLFGRELFYLCDADVAGRKNSTIKKLAAYRVNYSVIDLFPDRTDGYDLADAIFAGSFPCIAKPVQTIRAAPAAPEDEQTPKERNISEYERVERFISERYDLRYNEVSNKIECKRKGDSEFDALNEDNIYRELQINFINFPLTKLASLFRTSFVPRFNPFLAYFDNLPVWNSNIDHDYIRQLAGYIPVKDARFEVQLRKMLVRSIACSLGKTFNKQAFILVSEEQNTGKSTFCRWLCPAVLSEYIIENISMDKDSLIALSENFLINMDELATISRAEINQLKAFMSKDVIKARLPYAKRAETIPRRANFIGSTNKSEFLSDETGSVRWLCFELDGRIDFRYKDEINIDDVWRQAYYLFKNGFKYELTPEEISENERVNNRYRFTTTEQELIQAKFVPAKKEELGAEFKTSTDIMSCLFPPPWAKISNVGIGRAMKVLGFEQSQKRTGAFQVKGYYVKQVN